MTSSWLRVVTAVCACVTLPATGAGAQALATVYSFKGGSDGAWPLSGLVEMGGVLYGSTTGGARGHGAVFKVTQDGAEKVVYGFKSSLDGAEPFAGLLKVGALLYGTTYLGGRESAVSQGTVFKVSPGGTEAVLHYFSSVEADGAYPNAGLINVGGTLYGTTSRGGAFGLGAVFRITPAGAEKLVYSFKGGSDGATPAAGLLNVDGVLFGTTSSGGAGCDGGCGTVFKLTPSGVETVIHAFHAGSDGSQPEAGLIDVNGVLYGTTNSAGNGCDLGCGTVFKVSPEGAEAVVYAFKGHHDGAYPDAELTNVGGVLYGTTEGGGGHDCPDGMGCGTVFKLTPAGEETVVHAFTGHADGMYPGAGMINLGGTLYGTTFGGGDKDSGTVFKFAT